jgi:hypothetical protein
MTDLESASRVVRDALNSFPLRATYLHEQQDLQQQVQGEIERALRAAFPDRSFVVTICVGGTGKPSLKLLGTSFWLDIEVTERGEPLIAIEVKLIRATNAGTRRHAARSGPIAEALGQAVVYSCHYPKAFALVVHLGAYDSRCTEYDSKLEKCLARLNIELILRRPGEKPGM